MYILSPSNGCVNRVWPAWGEKVRMIPDPKTPEGVISIIEQIF
jgi:hypothetical protein